MTTPTPDHIPDASKKVMTDAEMLAKLERVIRLDNAWIESTHPEDSGNEMDSMQRWEIEAVIESLRVRVEAEKYLLKTFKQLKEANKHGNMTNAIDATLEELIKGLEDKDHA
jgi:hypothetical protein